MPHPEEGGALLRGSRQAARQVVPLFLGGGCQGLLRCEQAHSNPCKPAAHRAGGEAGQEGAGARVCL